MPRVPQVLLRCVVIVIGLVCTACTWTNPSFDQSRSTARAELRDMADDPRPAPRPVIVLGGYLDPGLLTEPLARDLRERLADAQVVSVSFSATADFESCQRRVLETLREELPDVMGEAGSAQTLPVDVVAISMGGLVARYMARKQPKGVKRLQVHRLYTISSPHQGAGWAWVPTFNRKQRQMRPGSDFLTQLNNADTSYPPEIYCYVRLRDSVVGPARSAPPGHAVWWVHTPFWQSPHLGAPLDPRIQADILRRLRGEPAYASRPAAALP